MPVGKRDFPGVGAAVGVQVVVFSAADAAYLEVADIDVADVDLAGVSGGVGGFGHGVAGCWARGTRFNGFCRAI